MSDRVVSQKTWTAYGLPGNVPEGCTHEQLIAAMEADFQSRELEDATKNLKYYEEWYQDAKEHSPDSPVLEYLRKSIELEQETIRRSIG